MSIFSVKFPAGHQVTIVATDKAEAMRKAFMDATRPRYCRIHDEIREHSDAPVGAMGNYYPPAPYPMSARLMREVYMAGGYCVIPAE